MWVGHCYPIFLQTRAFSALKVFRIIFIYHLWTILDRNVATQICIWGAHLLSESLLLDLIFWKYKFHLSWWWHSKSNVNYDKLTITHILCWCIHFMLLCSYCMIMKISVTYFRILLRFKRVNCWQHFGKCPPRTGGIWFGWCVNCCGKWWW